MAISIKNNDIINAPPQPKHPRMIERGDGYRLVFTGRRKLVLGDLYIRLLGARWRSIIVIMSTIYLLLNAFFAALYALTGGIANARPDSLFDLFFFSVQTFATIGYGAMYPVSFIANELVTLESMFSFAFYGVVTGLVFSKFSRPTARILFSHNAIITQQDGAQHFMLRLANERESRIVDATAKMTLMKDVRLADGKMMRRSYNLPLVRNEIPLLRLTWTLMHLIDENSPLHGMGHADLEDCEAEIVVSINGIDETLNQHIHARHSYIAEEILCNAQFEDVLIRHEDYTMEVRYDRFHSVKESVQTS